MSFSEDQIESMVTRALEQRPAVAVPEDFAVRVRAALPAVRPVPRRVSVGRAFGLGSAVGLTVALFAIAPHMQPDFRSLGFAMEMLVMVELGAVVWFLARQKAVGSD
jgi:hypothetical protein